LNNTLTISSYPAKILHQYIQAFKVYHFIDKNDVFLVPKGVFEIVFQSQHSFQHNTNYSSGWKLRPRNFIGGLHNQSYHVNSGTGDNYCIVVEFKPNSAKYFIPEKLDLFQNAVIDINEIWGATAQLLSQNIDREVSDRRKVEHIESFLLGKFKIPKKSVIDASVQELISSNGFTRINDLSDNASLSIAQFRKRFREEVGIAPSQYSKIVRIKTALDMIHKNQYSLTDISYTMGFFDQSHFIKDFKYIIGLSPKKYQSQLTRQF